LVKPQSHDTTQMPLPIQTGRVAESNPHGNAGLAISLLAMGKTPGRKQAETRRSARLGHGYGVASSDSLMSRRMRRR
jgi:hypothetical protein